MVTPRVAVIVLAAGRSTRFGPPEAHKLLAPLCGSPVIHWWVSRALEAGVGDVIVVTGTEAASFDVALRALPIRIVRALDAEDGMSASLRAGVQAVRGSVDAAIVSLADQPAMRSEAYRRVVEVWIATGAAIVSPRYRSSSAPAHPTLFAARVFDEIIALTGDVGARAVIARDPSRVTHATMDWMAPRDIDSVGDLAIAEAEMRQQATLNREQ